MVRAMTEDDEGRYGPQKPGGSNHSEEDETAEEAAKAELPDPGSRLESAHYAGMEEEDASEVWKRETLCVSCLSNRVCMIAAGIEGPLVVVSRCLAYLPSGG